MINFDFISPTKIFFGTDRHKEIGEIISSYKFKKIAFVYGGGSIKKISLYDDIIESLKNNNIEFIEVSGVQANPKLSFIKKAIKALKNEKIDMILAVGGGSVIDTCKLISHAMYYDKDPFDFNLNKAKINNVIPVGVILTISAAGSELSDSCVISNDEVTPYFKKGFNSETNRPLFAILNPTLSYSVNKYQTGCGIVDMLMHTLERYMNYNDDCLLSENIAIGLLKTVLYYGKIAIDNPNDYQARANLMLASSFSHNGLTGLGKKQGMRVHGLEHVLSGVYDEIAHGEGLAILWPAWCIKANQNKKGNILLTKLAKELFGLDDAYSGIIALKNYFNDIGMKTKFDENINIDLLTNEYCKRYQVNNNDFVILNKENVYEIFKLAKKNNYEDYN